MAIPKSETGKKLREMYQWPSVRIAGAYPLLGNPAKPKWKYHKHRATISIY